MQARGRFCISAREAEPRNEEQVLMLLMSIIISLLNSMHKPVCICALDMFPLKSYYPKSLAVTVRKTGSDSSMWSFEFGSRLVMKKIEHRKQCQDKLKKVKKDLVKIGRVLYNPRYSDAKKIHRNINEDTFMLQH